jgi:hypothetical protein
MSRPDTLDRARARVTQMAASGISTQEALAAVLAETLALREGIEGGLMTAMQSQRKSVGDAANSSPQLEEFMELLLAHLKARFDPVLDRLDALERRPGD